MYCFMTTPDHDIEPMSAVDNIISIQKDPDTNTPRTFSYIPRWAAPEAPPALYEFTHYGFVPTGLRAAFFAPTKATCTKYTALCGTEVFVLPDMPPQINDTVQ